MNKTIHPSIQGLPPAQRACCIRSGKLPVPVKWAEDPSMPSHALHGPFLFRGDPESHPSQDNCFVVPSTFCFVSRDNAAQFGAATDFQKGSWPDTVPASGNY